MLKEVDKCSRMTHLKILNAVSKQQQADVIVKGKKGITRQKLIQVEIPQ